MNSFLNNNNNNKTQTLANTPRDECSKKNHLYKWNNVWGVKKTLPTPPNKHQTHTVLLEILPNI